MSNTVYIKKPIEIVTKPEKCSYPYYVQFEVTTYCNLACKMCVRNETIKHPKHLSFDQFKKVYDQIRPKKLTLSGVGEPMLNLELSKIVSYAREAGSSVMIPSNGTILKNRKLTEQLVDSGLNVMKISIDAATRETYLKVRLEDYFDDIIEGIKLLEEIKKEKGVTYPELRFDVVILEENYKEIPQMIERAHELNIGTVYFRALQAEGIGGEREDEIGKGVDFAELYTAVQEGLKRSKTYKVKTNLDDIARDFRTYKSMYVEQDTKMQDHVCLLPWLQCFISVKGELSPCCATYSNEAYTSGNVFDLGFDAVWNGEEMKKLRRKFKAKQNDLKICTDCIPRSVPVLLKMSSMLPGFAYNTKDKQIA